VLHVYAFMAWTGTILLVSYNYGILVLDATDLFFTPVAVYHAVYTV
jgi:hypothetical protein